MNSWTQLAECLPGDTWKDPIEGWQKCVNCEEMKLRLFIKLCDKFSVFKYINII